MIATGNDAGKIARIMNIKVNEVKKLVKENKFKPLLCTVIDEKASKKGIASKKKNQKNSGYNIKWLNAHKNKEISSGE